MQQFHEDLLAGFSYRKKNTNICKNTCEENYILNKYFQSVDEQQIIYLLSA